ncbi:glutaminase [Pseudanabaena sp. FACHB-2040]|uniref:glutaminase n=1 Tax=Pseudanabaena sp. FACHB-2040 TaxID=2692859 RepID=UPI0016887545|nr:glutaminase [Pseudanabaena sp. FACHB-2040]MBD2256937.1 glutaminase [Pseudanabaena sp. FACHB-2040]
MDLSASIELDPAQLAAWAKEAAAKAAQGQVNTRISLLAQSDPAWFAAQIMTREGTWSWGDTERVFPLMSVVKPFLLLYLLEHCGQEQVFRWVGMTPSDAPFNSLEQLIADGGWPRNPMINSGAIALSAHLAEASQDATGHLCSWLNQQAGCDLRLDEDLLASVRQAGREPNQALLKVLVQAGQVQHSEAALDAYERACCLSGRIEDLAKLGKLLTFEQAVAYQHRCTVNALMLTCGLYEASSASAVRVGLPLKSGISGALLAVVPGWGAIAAYSPALDSVGNPVAALAWVKQLAQGLRLSVFG